MNGLKPIPLRITKCVATFVFVLIYGVGFSQQKPDSVTSSTINIKDSLSIDSQEVLDETKETVKAEGSEAIDGIKESVSNENINEVVSEQKDELSDVVDEKKEEVGAVVKDYGKEVGARKKDVVNNVNNAFEGEGITNDNAQDKLHGLINGTDLSTENIQDKAKGVMNTDLSNINLKDKAGDAIGGKDLSVDGLKDKANGILDKGPKGDIDLDNPVGSVKKVFSDKELKFAYDSLLRNVDWNVLNAMLRDPSSVSDATLLEAIFVKFPGLRQISRMKQDATILSAMANGTDPMRTLSSLASVHLHDLQKMRVNDSIMSQLPVLRGGKLDMRFLEYKQKYWDKLDSLRKINLKQAGLKLKETKISDSSKVSLIKRRFGFLNKIYVEGIVGLLNGGWNGNINLFQLSPALGYHLTKNFSLGLGPSLVLQSQSKKLSTILGLRSFAKYELLKSNFYLQAEDNFSFPRVDRTSIEEKTIDSQHAIMGGAGYLLPLSRKLALNISVLYRFAGNGNVPGLAGSSPWVYRFGISSNRKMNKL